MKPYPSVIKSLRHKSPFQGGGGAGQKAQTPPPFPAKSLAFTANPPPLSFSCPPSARAPPLCTHSRTALPQVTVVTSAGNYTAEQVIVTFSKGVLSWGDVKFDPVLPDWKVHPAPCRFLDNVSQPKPVSVFHAR